ncbi:uncharacterized protein LOC126842838 [Adelges cooleyi]|uniref:uncharacterized protein LOC126842838 n=1 Tax=Adelges cooleyi TaxID=133065 RepID=UPI00218033AC|nr:uncharacterized protein LOC126842838 [Adelges cooleyi]
MVRLDVLTSTILGLMLFVCQPAQSLETGCMYPSQVIVDEGIIHNDLKCTYLYSGLIHMLLTQHLTYFLYPSVLIGKIITYSHIVKCQIYSLYHLKVNRMDALWLIHLYLALVNSFYGESEDKKEVSKKILATLEYVITQLRIDLTDCRKDNTFNDEEQIFSNGNLSEIDLGYFMHMNKIKANELLKKNNILCDQTLNEYAAKTLQIGILLLNKICSKDVSMEDLMGVFNVQIEWHSTTEVLAQSWCDARNYFWTANKFVNLKLYYKLTFDFLKIMMFRLSLKHLAYLKGFISSIFYVEYTQEWNNKVKEFGDMLILSEDTHVENLLIHLDMLVKREETIDDVVKYLNSILEKLCEPFECEATKKFELYGNEFQTPYKSWIANYDLNLKKSPVKIERYSLENTRAFLCYLREMFKYNNFDLVRLLVEYINEMKM